jgi:hypothetical protein
MPAHGVVSALGSGGAVVAGALLGIVENFVRAGNLVEAGAGVGAGIHVRVIAARQHAYAR